MYTQCPHCEAIFRVSMKEITAAHGQLRCGECSNTFDAMNSLSSTLPDGLDQSMQTKTAENSTHPVLSKIKNSKDKPYSATPSQDRARKYMLWAGLGLITLLLLQALYGSRNWLAHQPLTSQATRSACKTLGCSITPQRDPTKIEVTSRNVYAHPNEPGSLIITATMRNTAPYEQPLPLIEVSFLDKNTDTVALRRFRPEEYTPKSRVDKELFIPNETITFRIKIEDPGKEAVTFQFNFL
ncbi:MAG: zinc-ribbon and DUF3426 domain-containing protein [Thiotrichaceae bacterium]